MLFARARLAAPALTAAALTAAAPATAATPEQVAQATALLSRGVGFKTVQGGGQIAAYANYLADQLKSAGFAASDIVSTGAKQTSVISMMLHHSARVLVAKTSANLTFRCGHCALSI